MGATTRDEWQQAVDQAQTTLALISANGRGLVRAAPHQAQNEAEEILRLGAEHGAYPSPDAVNRAMAAALRCDTLSRDRTAQGMERATPARVYRRYADLPLPAGIA